MPKNSPNQSGDIMSKRIKSIPFTGFKDFTIGGSTAKSEGYPTEYVAGMCMPRAESSIHRMTPEKVMVMKEGL